MTYKDALYARMLIEQNRGLEVFEVSVDCERLLTGISEALVAMGCTVDADENVLALLVYTNELQPANSVVAGL